MEYSHPNELANHLIFLGMIDGKYSDEYGSTTASVYAEAWAAVEYFLQHTPAEEGKELLRLCLGRLRAAYDALAAGETATGQRLAIEAEQAFKLSRRHIDVVDA